MNIKSCNFVEASEVFKDCIKAWDLFSESNPDCTWGDNNRTLVTKDVIINAIENVIDIDDEDNEPASCSFQVKKLFGRLDELPEYTYIDLEN